MKSENDIIHTRANIQDISIMLNSPENSELVSEFLRAHTLIKEKILLLKLK